MPIKLHPEPVLKNFINDLLDDLCGFHCIKFPSLFFSYMNREHKPMQFYAVGKTILILLEC